MRKTGKLKSNSLLIFYISSLTVIALRIILFADVFIGYPWYFYVICLITMPTFLYLITGLSIVMCNFELAIKFRICLINEDVHMKGNEKKHKIEKSETLLKILHRILGISMVIILLSFVVLLMVCRFSSICKISSSTSLLLPTSVLNYFVLCLMAFSTYFLVRSWRDRYGASYQQEV
jgi:hypothetical protein